MATKVDTRQISLKDICKGFTPQARRRYFATDEAIRCVGAKIARQEHKRLLLELRRLRSDTPSDSWTDAVDNHREEFPPGKREPCPLHGIRMKVSVISGRYTPPGNLHDEDALDGMSEHEAMLFVAPRSVSAAAIEQIRANKAREVGRRQR